MIRPLALGAWVSLVMFLASYFAAGWQAAAIAPQKEAEPYLAGLEYRKIPAVTVPMITAGGVGGYIVAKIVFTADARELHELPLDPEPFLADEAFRGLYGQGRVEFGKVVKQDLASIAATIRDGVNARIGMELIRDVLIEQIDYVDRSTIGKPG